MGILSEYEQDAFAESFNIGLGRAAASLSEMIRQEISLSVPTVEVMSKLSAKNDIEKSLARHVFGIHEAFDGPFSGSAFLLFPEDRSLELVRLLLQDEIDASLLTEVRDEALIEVGNIILNACLSSIGEIFNTEITQQMPEPISGDLSGIILSDKQIDNQDTVMSLRVEFSIESVDIKGNIAFIMDINSLVEFRGKRFKRRMWKQA